MAERAPVEHFLKTWPCAFAAVWSGRKRYEIRRQDRDFRVGDTLVLVEYDPEAGAYLGRAVYADVRHMTRGGEWGLPDDLCVMSLGEPVPCDPIRTEPEGGA